MEEGPKSSQGIHSHIRGSWRCKCFEALIVHQCIQSTCRCKLQVSAFFYILEIPLPGL